MIIAEHTACNAMLSMQTTMVVGRWLNIPIASKMVVERVITFVCARRHVWTMRRRWWAGRTLLVLTNKQLAGVIIRGTLGLLDIVARRADIAQRLHTPIVTKMGFVEVALTGQQGSFGIVSTGRKGL
jgi:hypothetical protein